MNVTSPSPGVRLPRISEWDESTPARAMAHRPQVTTMHNPQCTRTHPAVDGERLEALWLGFDGGRECAHLLLLRVDADPRGRRPESTSERLHVSLCLDWVALGVVVTRGARQSGGGRGSRELALASMPIGSSPRLTHRPALTPLRAVQSTPKPILSLFKSVATHPGSKAGCRELRQVFKVVPAPADRSCVERCRTRDQSGRHVDHVSSNRSQCKSLQFTTF
jgi:hypothetical protein